MQYVLGFLAAFTQHNDFEIHPYCCMYQKFISLCCGAVVHCLVISRWSLFYLHLPGSLSCFMALSNFTLRKFNLFSQRLRGPLCNFLMLFLCIASYCLVLYHTNFSHLCLLVLCSLAPQVNEIAVVFLGPLSLQVSGRFRQEKSWVMIRLILLIFQLSGITVLCCLFHIWKHLYHVFVQCSKWL